MSQPTFTLQLAMAAPVEALEAWLADAAPGNKAVYAHGVDLPREAAAVQLVRRWADAGTVTLTSQRDPADPRQMQWLVVRLGERPGAGPACSAGAPNERTRVECAELLSALRHAALCNLPCPSNTALARKLQLGRGERGRSRAQYLIGQLVAEGAIRVAGHGRNHPRVVTITAKGRACGRSTREPGRGDT